MGSKTVAAPERTLPSRALIKALRLQLAESLLPGDAPVDQAALDEAAEWLVAAAAIRAISSVRERPPMYMTSG